MVGIQAARLDRRSKKIKPDAKEKSNKTLAPLSIVYIFDVSEYRLYFLVGALNKSVMAELKRFTDFDSLKLAAKSNQETITVKPDKLKEQSIFFEVLRANLVVKTTQKKG